MTKLHPAEVFNQVCSDLLMGMWLCPHSSRFKAPIGEYYNKLPEDQKEVLKNLTSKDASNVRDDFIKSHLP